MTSASLPRRAFLGIRLPSGPGAFGPEGMTVGAVVDGSMARTAGLAPGDVVSRLAGEPVTSFEALVTVVRRLAGAKETMIETTRAGVAETRRVAVRGWPREAIEGHEVRYDAVLVRGARLRTIVTQPRSAEHASCPAVMLLQGLDTVSIDFGAAPAGPLCELVHGLARAGFVTMRVDKRGVGDSEGSDPARVDFETELDGYRTALHALVAEPCVDPARVFAFGHSVGGMLAPLLAREASLGAAAVYGTSAARWVACLEAGARRQLALRGVAQDEIERIVARERRVLADEPDEDALVHDRSLRYHRQLDSACVAAAWRAARVPVLVMHGEHDWVVGAGEAEHIVELVSHDGTDARLMRLPGLDHWMTRHASREDSLRHRGAGVPDGSVLRETVRWIDMRCGRRR